MGSPPTDKVLLNGVATVVNDLAEFAPLREMFQTYITRWRKKNCLRAAQWRKAEAQLAKLWPEEPKAADSDEYEHWPAWTIFSPDRTEWKVVQIPPKLYRKLPKYHDPSVYHLLPSLDTKQDFSPTESFILLAEIHHAAYPKDQLLYAKDQIIGISEATEIRKNVMSQVAVDNLATIVERVLDRIEARADSKSKNETGKTLHQIIQRSREKLADLVIRSRPHFVAHTGLGSVQDAIDASHSKLAASNEAQERRLAAQIQIDADRQRQQQTETGGKGGADKREGQTDTPQKSKRKPRRRLLDIHAKACIKEFKEYKKLGDLQSMRQIVKEYVATHDGVSESGTYRRLTDNRDQWAT